MKWKLTFFPQIIVFTLVIAASLLGCGGQELASTWRNREVSVDGVSAEWEGSLIYLGDENVAIGLSNDDDYLYLCLATVDSRVVRQVVGAGLTVWFDPKGGKKKTFGVNYPVGMRFSRSDFDRDNMPEPGIGENVQDAERFRTMLETATREMVILGPGQNETRNMPAASSQEVLVKIGYEGGKLVYELRVPLHRDLEHPDAIGFQDGRCIGLGFETAEIEREEMRNRMKNARDGGGPPRGGGARGGGMRDGGGMPGGRRPGGEMSERLVLWTKVSLAANGGTISR